MSCLFRRKIQLHNSLKCQVVGFTLHAPRQSNLFISSTSSVRSSSHLDTWLLNFWLFWKMTDSLKNHLGSCLPQFPPFPRFSLLLAFLASLEHHLNSTNRGRKTKLFKKTFMKIKKRRFDKARVTKVQSSDSINNHLSVDDSSLYF